MALFSPLRLYCIDHLIIISFRNVFANDRLATSASP